MELIVFIRRKTKAREEDTSIIYHDKLGELHNKYYDLITEMPGHVEVSSCNPRESKGTQNQEKVLLEENTEDET